MCKATKNISELCKIVWDSSYHKLTNLQVGQLLCNGEFELIGLGAAGLNNLGGHIELENKSPQVGKSKTQKITHQERATPSLSTLEDNRFCG
jgi:hypothetical protein